MYVLKKRVVSYEVYQLPSLASTPRTLYPWPISQYPFLWNYMKDGKGKKVYVLPATWMTSLTAFIIMLQDVGTLVVMKAEGGRKPNDGGRSLQVSCTPR